MKEPSVSSAASSAASSTADATPQVDRIVITCEHGGARIPPAYQPLFDAHRDLLGTHRGYDFGALQLAREMSVALGAPLYASTTSRLLVDLNRSIGNPALHSEATRHLPLAERRRIVDRYWRPHRQLVESQVADAVGQGRRVVHIASHSFTPELHGEVRNADIGLLYDPRRPGEGALARLWMKALKKAKSDLRVRLNYPYQGKGDGLTSTLRSAHDPTLYVGIELEVNQAWAVRGGPPWRKLRGTLIDTLRSALAKFAESPV